MTPISFTVRNGVTYFHYKPSEIIDFVRIGKKYGNVGMILTKREGNVFTYRGFGTIENPFTNIATILFTHSPFFDGEMTSDEQRLIPPKPFLTPENTRFVIIDLSNEESEFSKMSNITMKPEQKRGQLTERIKQKSVELFGYEITQKELRLIPYVLYEAQNTKRVNNVDEGEQKILSSWIDKGFLLVTGLGNILSISEEFWNKANQIVFLGYVEVDDEHERIVRSRDTDLDAEDSL